MGIATQDVDLQSNPSIAHIGPSWIITRGYAISQIHRVVLTTHTVGTPVNTILHWQMIRFTKQVILVMGLYSLIT